MKKIAVLVGLLAALVMPAHADIQTVSSATITADWNQNIVQGKAWLYKIIVSTPGTGTAQVAIGNNGTGAVVASSITLLDATAVRDIEYGCYLSSGIGYTVQGTQVPGVSILYSRRIPTTNPMLATSQVEEARPYSCFYSTGIYVARNVKAGRIFLKRVIVSKPDPAGTLLSVFDSSGTSTRKIGDINTATVKEYKYNVMLSSGLSYTTVGTPGVTFVYDLY